MYPVIEPNLSSRRRILLLTVVCTAAVLPGPAQAWIQYLDGSTLPDAPWTVFQQDPAGDTVVVNFLDPQTRQTNQALRLDSGTGANEWYVGPFNSDEIVAGARFRVATFSSVGKENLLCVTPRSRHVAPSPSISLVDGRYKLWSYVESNAEIMDLGPVDTNTFHTAYLYARSDGVTRLWWDGQLIFDGLAPQVNPYDGYLEWGSGSWQFDAVDTVDFDWVGWGEASDLPQWLVTIPPHGAVFQDPAAGFRFTIVTGQGFGPGVGINGVAITVNGVDRTGDLVISGSDTNRQGLLASLQINRDYQVRLRITDLAGRVANYPIEFDTFSPTNFLFEAEDFNFSGGQFLDNIVLSSTAGPDNYLERDGVEGIDQRELNTDPVAPHDYRSTSLVGTEFTLDTLRPKYIDAQATDPDVADYNVADVAVGEWLNYTRTFPAGNYNIYGRTADGVLGGSFEAVLDKVTGATTTNQTLSPLGVFKGGPGHGWQLYKYVPLTDAQSNLVAVNLSGTETLRVSLAQGGCNANFYMLVPAQAASPVLSIGRSGGNVIVSWTGTGLTLETVDRLGALWAPVSNPTNPLMITPSEAARFYRLRQ